MDKSGIFVSVFSAAALAFMSYGTFASNDSFDDTVVIDDQDPGLWAQAPANIDSIHWTRWEELRQGLMAAYLACNAEHELEPLPVELVLSDVDSSGETPLFKYEVAADWQQSYKDHALGIKVPEGCLTVFNFDEDTYRGLNPLRQQAAFPATAAAPKG